jgi:AAA domain
MASKTGSIKLPVAVKTQGESQRDTIINIVPGSELGSANKFRWLVRPILPVGLTIVAGDRGSGKTALCMDAAVGVAGGSTILGRFAAEEPGKVLYISPGAGLASIKTRLDLLEASKKAIRNLDFITREDRPGFLLGEGERMLRRTLKGGGYRLLVFDTLVPLVSDGTRAVTDLCFGYAEALLLRRLADDFGIAIFASIHTGKYWGKWPGDFRLEKVIDSDFSGLMDTCIVIQRIRNRRAGFFHLTSKSTKSLTFRALFDSGKWKYLRDYQELTPKELMLLNYLKTGSYMTDDLADFLGTGYEAAERQVLKLCDKGYAYFHMDEGWAVVPHGLTKTD